jgi:hypothetical protein
MSELFDVPGFRLKYVTIDAMHCIDLGTAQYCLGNVLYELFIHVGGSSTKPEKALASVLFLIRLASRQVGYRFPPLNALTLGMIKSGAKPPRLKAKAAETRRMVPVVLCMLENFFPKATLLELTRYQCVQSLNDIYKTMESWGPGSVETIGRLGRQHVILYSQLGMTYSLCKPWVFWRLYPKHHLMLHLLEEQVATADNPRFCWSYQDESEIGLAVTVAESTHVRGMGKLVLQKYRHWLGDSFDVL